MAQFFIGKHEGNKLLVISIFFLPVLVYFFLWFYRVAKDKKAANFKNTMQMNWLAATCTNLAFLTLLIWRWFE
jgi:1,4-dihydroxy-2-naphthoate octaprenyltransferase